jgi:hypothetical protein
VSHRQQKAGVTGLSHRCYRLQPRTAVHRARIHHVCRRRGAATEAGRNGGAAAGMGREGGAGG